MTDRLIRIEPDTERKAMIDIVIAHHRDGWYLDDYRTTTDDAGVPEGGFDLVFKEAPAPEL